MGVLFFIYLKYVLNSPGANSKSTQHRYNQIHERVELCTRNIINDLKRDSDWVSLGAGGREFQAERVEEFEIKSS